MAYIQLPPDGAGKKHRSWEITEGADDVHATAGVVTAPDGTVLAEADGLVVQGGVASGAADSGDPVKVGGVYNVTPPSIDDGDRADLQLDENGRLILSYQSLVQFTDSDGHAVLLEQVTDDDTPASRRALPTRSHLYGFDGTGWDRVRGDSANGLDVDVTRLPGVTGDVASGAADSGNPVKVGGRYNSTPPTLTNGQRGDLQLDTAGRLQVADGGGSLTVDGTVAVSSMPFTEVDIYANGVSPETDDASADNAGLTFTNGLLTTARLALFDGTNYDRARGDTANGLDVDVTRVSGTVATQEVRPSTAAVTAVNDTASSVQLLASTAGRMGAMIFNDSTEPLYVKFGTTASTSSFTVKILAAGYFEFPQPVYTGRVDGIWGADASGVARITELTA